MIEVIRRLCCIPFISWIQLFFDSKARQNVTQSHSLSMKNNMKWCFACNQYCNNDPMKVDSHNSNPSYVKYYDIKVLSTKNILFPI